VEKITCDIRDLQKSISSATATVQRADAIAEETIYSAANAPSPDPVVVDLYRQLKTLRSRFETLVETVNKIGIHEKTAHDLETKIEQETTRVSVNNANRIKTDLDQIRSENAQLVAEVKSLSGRA
jgi:small-conductance mechanosensitive channel